MEDPHKPFSAGWFARNKLTVAIACGVGVLVLAAEGASDPPQPQPGFQTDGSEGGMGPQGGFDPQGGGMGPQGGFDPQGGGMGPQGGFDPQGGGTVPTAAPGGGVDMDEWRRREAESDEAQRRRIDTIREEERCRNSDGTEDTVSIHTGC